jgi:hypothetical protein
MALLRVRLTNTDNLQLAGFGIVLEQLDNALFFLVGQFIARLGDLLAKDGRHGNTERDKVLGPRAAMDNLDVRVLASQCHGMVKDVLAFPVQPDRHQNSAN